jgi:hypothetical protein
LDLTAGVVALLVDLDLNGDALTQFFDVADNADMATCG